MSSRELAATSLWEKVLASFQRNKMGEARAYETFLAKVEKMSDSEFEIEYGETA